MNACCCGGCCCCLLFWWQNIRQTRSRCLLVPSNFLYLPPHRELSLRCSFFSSASIASHFSIHGKIAIHSNTLWLINNQRERESERAMWGLQIKSKLQIMFKVFSDCSSYHLSPTWNSKKTTQSASILLSMNSLHWRRALEASLDCNWLYTARYILLHWKNPHDPVHSAPSTLKIMCVCVCTWFRK